MSSFLVLQRHDRGRVFILGIPRRISLRVYGGQYRSHGCTGLKFSFLLFREGKN